MNIHVLGIGFVVAQLVCCSWLASCVHYDGPSQLASDDEIKQLPGLSQSINFKHYSGYLNVDQAGAPKNNSFLHYWFVESQSSNPLEDPLILWLSGGPGCSSLMGLFNELGPFAMGTQPGEVVLREHSWNKFANLLFLESPIYAGYSYTKLGEWLVQGDDSTAVANKLALESFYAKYPQFKQNPLYLAGESYAGVYVLTLGKLLDGDQSFNLKGVAVGNGLMDEEKSYMSLLLSAYHHGLYGKSRWEALSGFCCSGQPPSMETCRYETNITPCGNLIVGLVEDLLWSRLNPYNIYKDCATKSTLDGKQRLDVVPRCGDNDQLIEYLNRADVRAIMHVPSELAGWKPCATLFYEKKYVLVRGGLAPQMNQLCDSKRNLTMLMYYGDLDLTVNFMGAQWFADSLNRKLVREWIPWHVNGQVAGFVKHYQQLSFVTVKGAGHMAPQDKPAEVSALIEKWLYPRGRKPSIKLC